MSVRGEYCRWLRATEGDGEIHSELLSIENNDRLIESAFFRELEFGTGGLRGTIGAGTNRMNLYTVSRATRGLAKYLKAKVGECDVAIGYDTRHKSRQFAEISAATLCHFGIRVHMYSSPLPTPTLSYALRELGCAAGIMITASHNPAEYNGYKVYGSDGCQITEEMAEGIFRHICTEDYFDVPAFLDFEQLIKSGSIEYIPDSLLEGFIDRVCELSSLFGDEADKGISIVYTPLNGTGYIPVSRILHKNGYTGVTIVEEQATPDGSFPTCPKPNPELPEALALGLEYAKDRKAEILLATDPDCDRVGVAVRVGEEYKILTGNQVGILLLDYIASQKIRHGVMPRRPIAIKTVVTSALAQRVAKSYGIETVNVLTGFKYIGEVIGRLEKAGELRSFVIGFEESCGYLSGTHSRDKDGVNAAYLIAEMCAFFKAKGITLWQRLNDIYNEMGYEKTALFSYDLEGVEGANKIKSIMRELRGIDNPISSLGIQSTTDYSLGIGDLPPSDVVSFLLSDGSTLTVRPSGTEPKIKIYLSVFSDNEEMAKKRIEEIRGAFESLI